MISSKRKEYPVSESQDIGQGIRSGCSRSEGEISPGTSAKDTRLVSGTGHDILTSPPGKTGP